MAEILAARARAGESILLGGAFTKNRLGGSMAPAAARISTEGLAKLLQYEPKDLTISVQAGMKWADLLALLAGNRQTIPLDPPWGSQATAGGVVVSNLCGPRRRFFGSARDMVIGMKYATLEGKLVQTGGMVVKNVAGLDTAKLMIGSLGTLAAVVSVNFKLFPAAPATGTWLFHYASLAAAIEKRNWLLAGVLQPWSADLLNPHAAAMVGEEGWVLAIQAGGSERLMERYGRELHGARRLYGEREERFWNAIREFAPAFLRDRVDGVVARLPVPLASVGDVAATASMPFLCRAGNGVCQGFFPDIGGAAEWLRESRERGWNGVVEFHGSEGGGQELWPYPGEDLAAMEKIKRMLDPGHLLNRGRLHGRI